MFDAVLQGAEVPTRRIGAGVILSVAVHVVALAAVVYVSAHQVKEAKKPTDVVFRQALPPPAPGPPPPLLGGGGAPSPPVEQPKKKKPPPIKKDTLVESKQKEDDKPREPERPTEPEPAASGGPGGPGPAGPGNDPNGSRDGVIGGTGGPGGVAGGTGTGAAPVNVTIPFGEGMVRPTQAGGPTIDYTREAREAKWEGTIIARCTITVTGSLTGCQIIKGHPLMDQAVLATLAAQRYTPVTFQGHPVQVFYTLQFHFKLPR